MSLLKKILVFSILGMIFFSCTWHKNHTDNPVMRKKMFSFRKSGDTYNPTLKAKGKNKPSSKLAQDDKKVIKNAKRTVRKERRRLIRKGKLSKPPKK